FETSLLTDSGMSLKTITIYITWRVIKSFMLNTKALYDFHNLEINLFVMTCSLLTISIFHSHICKHCGVSICWVLTIGTEYGSLIASFAGENANFRFSVIFVHLESQFLKMKPDNHIYLQLFDQY